MKKMLDDFQRLKREINEQMRNNPKRKYAYIMQQLKEDANYIWIDDEDE